MDGRPLQISAVINSMLASSKFGPAIDPNQIGVFGFSAGGYTVLTLLSAKPDFDLLVQHCRSNYARDPVCEMFDGGIDEYVRNLQKEFDDTIVKLADDRICGAVIADPFAVVFSEESVKQIRRIPTLFYLPEIENQLAAKYHGGHVYNILKADNKNDVQLITVKGAQHFSFITPFPESIAKSLPLIANDFGDFDRDKFHHQLSSQIPQFFNNAFQSCNTDSQ